MPSKDITVYEEIFKDLITRQKRVSFKFEWCHQNGTKRFAKCHTGPLKEGDNIIGIQIHLRDITEEEKTIIDLAEDIIKRKQAEERLKESEKKYRIIAENTNDAIWILNLNSMRLDFISPSIKSISGYSSEEHIRRPFEEILASPSLEPVTKMLFENLESEKNRKKEEEEISQRFEWQEVHKDGHFVWVEAEMRFLKDDAGNPVSVLGVSRDISQRKKNGKGIKKPKRFY